MANDKMTMLKLKRMLQLLDAGKSMNEICRDLHMSKRTVHNHKQRGISSSVPLAELRRMDDKRLHLLLQPNPQSQNRTNGKTSSTRNSPIISKNGTNPMRAFCSYGRSTASPIPMDINTLSSRNT